MSKSGSVPEFRDSVEAAIYCLGGHKIVKDVVKKAMRRLEKDYEKDPLDLHDGGYFRRFDVIEFDFGNGKERGVVNHIDYEDMYMTKPKYGIIRSMEINGKTETYLQLVSAWILKERAKVVYRVDINKLKTEEEMRKKAEEEAKNDNA